jgi:hypothetical protein
MTTQRKQYQTIRPNGRFRKAYGTALAVILGVSANASLALPNEGAGVDYGNAGAFETAAPMGECKMVCPFPGFSDDAGESTTQPVLQVVPQAVGLLNQRQ